MKNFSQSGKILDLTAPGGGVVSGDAVKIGVLLVVPQETVAATLPFAGVAEGVFEFAKLGTDVVTEGAKLNWNDATKQLQLATSTIDGIATAVIDAGNGVLLVHAKLTQI